MNKIVFSHPDYTVGFGITPNQPHAAGRGLYRREGITPCPEEPIHLLFSFKTITNNNGCQLQKMQFFVAFFTILLIIDIDACLGHNLTYKRHI